MNIQISRRNYIKKLEILQPPRVALLSFLQTILVLSIYSQFSFSFQSLSYSDFSSSPQTEVKKTGKKEKKEENWFLTFLKTRHFGRSFLETGCQTQFRISFHFLQRREQKTKSDNDANATQYCIHFLSLYFIVLRQPENIKK